MAILALAAALWGWEPRWPPQRPWIGAAYQGVYVGFSAQTNARASGYLTCPPGRKAVGGRGHLPSSDGAFFSLAPTEDGVGWYVAAGLNSSTGPELRFCVPSFWSRCYNSRGS